MWLGLRPQPNEQVNQMNRPNGLFRDRSTTEYELVRTTKDGLFVSSRPQGNGLLPRGRKRMICSLVAARVSTTEGEQGLILDATDFYGFSEASSVASYRRGGRFRSGATSSFAGARAAQFALVGYTAPRGKDWPSGRQRRPAVRQKAGTTRCCGAKHCRPLLLRAVLDII